jgi:hypothetical protein
MSYRPTPSLRSQNRLEDDSVFGESCLWILTSSVADKIPDFPLDLPDDPLGVVAGSRYIPHLRAGRGHARSTGFSFHSPKFGRVIECQSATEAALAKTLHLNPYVVDVRDHYVIASSTKLMEKLKSGKRIRKYEAPTIDLIATLRHVSSGLNLTYHGFSVKRGMALGPLHVKRDQSRPRSNRKAGTSVGKGKPNRSARSVWIR